MKIPITVCHGLSDGPQFHPKRKRLTVDRFEEYFGIAAELGFQSISYDDLAGWRDNDRGLPQHPIMFDFDHPNRSIARVIWPIMQRYGFTGNLFVNTSPMEKAGDPRYMTWDEIRALVSDGWHIGSHMHNHFKMSYLAKKDPSGGLIREQFDKCDGLLRTNLGIESKDFAFTGTTWSRVAEDEVKKRYRFGRLWIIDSRYETDHGSIRLTDLLGVRGPDEDDGGPPFSARYITRRSNPYRLPSMELEFLIYEYSAFREYLDMAMESKDSNPIDRTEKRQSL